MSQKKFFSELVEALKLLDSLQKSALLLFGFTRKRFLIIIGHMVEFEK